MATISTLASSRHSAGGISGYLLGFAFGGFFDGIVLHQILQWHHLLSGIDADPWRDMRMQIVADGVFHAVMYVIAAIGLWQLYRAGRNGNHTISGQRLFANFLIGFGLWHVVDSVLSHWILGIHRIRMDVPNPLAWDIGWLVVSGLTSLAGGLWLRRRAARDDAIARSGGPGASGAKLMLATAVIASGLLAGIPPTDTDRTSMVMVVLRPDVPATRLLAQLDALDARIVWSSTRGDTWALATGPRTNALAFYRHGALYVSGTLAPAGCSAWVARAPAT